MKQSGSKWSLPSPPQLSLTAALIWGEALFKLQIWMAKLLLGTFLRMGICREPCSGGSASRSSTEWETGNSGWEAGALSSEQTSFKNQGSQFSLQEGRAAAPLLGKEEGGPSEPSWGYLCHFLPFDHLFGDPRLIWEAPGD